jgi:Outer membrane protein beta-barrel domain
LRNLILLCFAFLGVGIGSAMAQSSLPMLNYDVGGGFGIGRGAVGSFVGNSFEAEAGVGMNFTRMFGFNAEYMYYNLNLRQGVSENQALPNGVGHMNSWSLNGLVRAPFHFGRLGAYGIFGVGFYQRVNSATTGAVAAGSRCQPAWVWWDIYCVNGFVLSQQYIGSNTKVAGGFNAGGGATYRLNRWHDAKLFLEWRYHRAYTSDIQTTVMPVTVGLRW